ncbi:hypothetical protein K458DRAFT_407919 [Lentithecium fluviatile CBS 122367]|uniref:Uncharacterized protein n=1 Tax=Lentithecium fluviatile CBS 122367 TaxID=1168545 RepID=A0A6G1IMR0_9PLEO|nr:hypothetical protein K458DRAFT_407919 [Lentithecium fluviatile CBS 122367]
MAYWDLAVFLLLHIRELDAGRNVQRFKDPVRPYSILECVDIDELFQLGFWIHPLRPTSLIELSVASYNSLLSVYHTTLTCAPTTLNRDLPETQALVGNDQFQVSAMKAPQSCVKHLREYYVTIYRPGS